ncbi:hypothetical protein H0H93_013823, partial [Arthromyces matolae]
MPKVKKIKNPGLYVHEHTAAESTLITASKSGFVRETKQTLQLEGVESSSTIFPQMDVDTIMEDDVPSVHDTHNPHISASDISGIHIKAKRYENS